LTYLTKVTEEVFLIVTNRVLTYSCWRMALNDGKPFLIFITMYMAGSLSGLFD